MAPDGIDKSPAHAVHDPPPNPADISRLIGCINTLDDAGRAIDYCKEHLLPSYPYKLEAPRTTFFQIVVDTRHIHEIFEEENRLAKLDTLFSEEEYKSRQHQTYQDALGDCAFLKIVSTKEGENGGLHGKDIRTSRRRPRSNSGPFNIMDRHVVDIEEIDRTMIPAASMPADDLHQKAPDASPDEHSREGCTEPASTDDNQLAATLHSTRMQDSSIIMAASPMPAIVRSTEGALHTTIGAVNPRPESNKAGTKSGARPMTRSEMVGALPKGIFGLKSASIKHLMKNGTGLPIVKDGMRPARTSSSLGNVTTKSTNSATKPAGVMKAARSNKMVPSSLSKPLQPNSSRLVGKSISGGGIAKDSNDSMRRSAPVRSKPK